jgi:primase-polymerase (primpol)-like protein
MISDADVEAIANIPAELRKLPQWVGWQHKMRNGKETKVPINPQTGRFASVKNPVTWGTFYDALKACVKFSCNGIGFVFTEHDEFVGIDLDACHDPETGALTPWAKKIVDAMDSYTEVSPSGYGVKIVARGKLLDGNGRVKKLSGVPTFGPKEPEIAIYDRLRYFCMTGQRLQDSQAGCAPHQANGGGQ